MRNIQQEIQQGNIKSARVINETEKKIEELNEDQIEIYESGFRKNNISQLVHKEKIVIAGKTYDLDTQSPLVVMFNQSPLSCGGCNQAYFMKFPESQNCGTCNREFTTEFSTECDKFVRMLETSGGECSSLVKIDALDSLAKTDALEIDNNSTIDASNIENT